MQWALSSHIGQNSEFVHCCGEVLDKILKLCNGALHLLFWKTQASDRTRNIFKIVWITCKVAKLAFAL